MEEDGEWMVALKAALAPQPPRPGETGDQPKGRQRVPKPIQGSPPTKGDQEAGASRRAGDSGPHRGRGHRPGVRGREEATPP